MSRFNDLKKREHFINKAMDYSEGLQEQKSKRITISMTDEYISLLSCISKKERLPKSQIIRAALLKFSTLLKHEKEEVYNKIFPQ